MPDAILSRLVELVGGSVAVAVLLYMTRGAIAVAVDQAAKREIEKYRGDLARELERERQAFSREIEREKQGAAQALEGFKSELTFGAEVRRQTAMRKVEAVMKIASATRASVEAIYTVIGYDPSPRKAALNSYHEALREVLVLFDSETIGEAKAFGAELIRGCMAMGRRDPGASGAVADALITGEAARDKLLEVLRRELQIETKEKQTTAEPSKGAK
jgi:hypothetical protein